MFKRSMPLLLAPILSGLMIGTTYIPFPPWALLFGLVPLFVSWSRRPSLKMALLQGWTTQFVLNLIGFHWVAHTAFEFGHLPRPIAFLVLILFAATAHLYYAVAGPIAIWIAKKRNLNQDALIFLFVFILLFSELVFPVLFPWHLGYPWLWAKLPGSQLADVIGFEGLNVVSVLCNGMLACAWIYSSSSLGKIRRSYVYIGITTVFFVAVNFLGWQRNLLWQKTDAELKIVAVQGNVGNYEKLWAERGAHYQQDIFDKYTKLSTQAFNKFPEADAAVWPETAFPDNLDMAFAGRPLPAQLRSYARLQKKLIMTGAYSQETHRNRHGKFDYFNGFFIIDSMGEYISEGYRKSILLAFGEYFPGSEYYPWVFDLIPTISSFGRGKGPTMIATPLGNVGPQICYEGLYPWFSAGLAEKGAEVFINVTNDSWFGNDFEPYQHLYMTLARAIEFRRPLLRTTNTGITTGILASGEMLQRSPQNQEWYGLYKIPYRKNPPHTLYEQIHWLWPWLLLLAILCTSIGKQWKLSTGPNS